MIKNKNPAPDKLTEEAIKSAGDIQHKPGTLYYDTMALKLPPGVLEEKPAKRRVAGMSPALLIILLLAAVFIIAIAIVISRMP